MAKPKSGLVVLIVAVFPLLLGTGLYFLLQPEPTPEDQIREAIQAVAAGAREQDLGATMRPISKAYHDEEGLSFDNLRGLLFSEFRRRGAISVLLGPIEVAMDPSEAAATATVDVALAEGVDVSSLELFPTNADALRFEVALQREGEDWKVVSQTHEPIR